MMTDITDYQNQLKVEPSAAALLGQNGVKLWLKNAPHTPLTHVKFSDNCMQEGELYTVSIFTLFTVLETNYSKILPKHLSH